MAASEVAECSEGNTSVPSSSQYPPSHCWVDCWLVAVDRKRLDRPSGAKIPVRNEPLEIDKASGLVELSDAVETVDPEFKAFGSKRGVVEKPMRAFCNWA